MIPTRNNPKSLPDNFINQAILQIYPPRVTSGKLISQGFGFACATIWVSQALLYKSVYFFGYFFVGLLPIQIIRPRLVRK
jgi:hypothetical protein